MSSSKIIRLAVRRHLFLAALILLSTAVSVITALIPPVILGRVVDRLSRAQDISLLMIFSYFGLILISGVFESGRESLLVIFGQKVTHTLRSALCAKLKRLPADCFVKTQPGVTASRFVGDVDTVEELFTSGIISMFADLCKVVSLFVMIFLRSKGLALVLVLILPLIFIFTRAVQKRMLRAQIDNRAAQGRVTAMVPETIHSIRTIHTLGCEGFMRERYSRGVLQSYQAVEKTNFYDAVYSPVINIISAAVIALIYLLAASGRPSVQSFFGMSVGGAVTIVSWVSQIFAPLDSIGMEIQTIQSAAAGVHRIDEFLAQPERPAKEEVPQVAAGTAENAGVTDAGMARAATGAAAAKMPAPEADAGAGKNTDAILLSHVTFRYADGEDVLRDLSLRVNKGERVYLSGRTGAGKSTIFKLILGLYPANEGQVLVNGQDAYRIPDSAHRKIFGYVEQSFRMVPGNIRDQITLFDPSVTQEMVCAAAETVGLDSVIEKLEKGYDTPCREDLFSQGQWQLLSIARAVAADPEILLLDEITANLDAETELTVLHALSRASANRTVLSISHRLYEEEGNREISIS
ncbi:MAG: ABC transporter ATP-binding protein [Lachnospiraceae bacterium]|nr:ABC transporter ATP-binding protein [Lachnospiraceae bacterium]